MDNKIKAVFFDRDGVVNMRMVNDYVRNIREFNFLPDFLSFFPKVLKSGCSVFLITNQQGVSKGIMTLNELQDVLNFMQNKLIDLYGTGFHDIFYCTDLADSGSYYRKPNPGMIIDAVNKWNIDVNKSWVIGDSPTDAAAGKRAGLNTILLGDYKKQEHPDADFIVMDLYDIEDKVPIFT
ncbi:HAD-IIIA family hydrolase [Bacteroidota bacterium]